MYDSWDMKCDGQFFVILDHFLHLHHPLPIPPPPSTNKTKKQKFWKNEKNNWRYHQFTQVYQKSGSYARLFLTYDTWQMSLLIFILGYFLPSSPPPPLTTQKTQIFKKWKKNPSRYWHFTHVYIHVWWTNKQKKWHIEVGAQPKNLKRSMLQGFPQSARKWRWKVTDR